MNYSPSEFRSGLKVIIEGDPCTILEHEFVNPGKGQAFTRIKLRHLINGRVWQRTFKSGESVPAANVNETNMQFLFFDNEHYHFMQPETFEQYMASSDVVGDGSKWIKDGEQCVVTLYMNSIIAVSIPNHVRLEITESEPGIKGDTAQGATKIATLSTGTTIKVPLFVEEGDVVRIDTRTGEYLGRMK